MRSFRATAYYGQSSISIPVEGEDAQAAMINAELAFAGASMIVVEMLR